MYIYLDLGGAVKEIINDEALRQTASDANSIHVYFEGADGESLLCSYELPDGTITPEAEVAAATEMGEIPYDDERDLVAFEYYKDYPLYSFKISDEALSQDGSVRMTLRFLDKNGRYIKAAGLIAFNVEAEVSQADSGVTQAQYNYLAKAWTDTKTALPLDGSKPMQGNLDMGKHDIVFGDDTLKRKLNDLQGSIDTINATQNVVDIVGTKADLNAYETRDLHDKDKIEVLTDESQKQANTIYEWNGSAWKLIGSKAPYYSKSESDGKYGAKAEVESLTQDTQNLAEKKLDKDVFTAFYNEEFKPVKEDDEYYALGHTFTDLNEEQYQLTDDEWNAIYNGGKPKNLLINGMIKLKSAGAFTGLSGTILLLYNNVGFNIIGLTDATYKFCIIHEDEANVHMAQINLSSMPKQITVDTSNNTLTLSSMFIDDADERAKIGTINGEPIIKRIGEADTNKLGFQLVDLASDQTIAGAKRFTGRMRVAQISSAGYDCNINISDSGIEWGKTGTMGGAYITVNQTNIIFHPGANDYSKTFDIALPKKSGTIALLDDISTSVHCYQHTIVLSGSTISVSLNILSTRAEKIAEEELYTLYKGMAFTASGGYYAGKTQNIASHIVIMTGRGDTSLRGFNQTENQVSDMSLSEFTSLSITDNVVPV